jgi:hypothetical protein
MVVFSEDYLQPGTGLIYTGYFSIDSAAAPQTVVFDSIFYPPAGNFALTLSDGYNIIPHFVSGQVELSRFPEHPEGFTIPSGNPEGLIIPIQRAWDWNLEITVGELPENDPNEPLYAEDHLGFGCDLVTLPEGVTAMLFVENPDRTSPDWYMQGDAYDKIVYEGDTIYEVHDSMLTGFYIPDSLAQIIFFDNIPQLFKRTFPQEIPGESHVYTKYGEIVYNRLWIFYEVVFRDFERDANIGSLVERMQVFLPPGYVHPWGIGRDFYDEDPLFNEGNVFKGWDDYSYKQWPLDSILPGSCNFYDAFTFAGQHVTNDPNIIIGSSTEYT